MFQVRLFGFFRMTKDGQIINESSMRSPQLTRLLVYLILYRDRAVTNQELEQYLWSGVGKAHQSEALKNLIYRMRKELSNTFGAGEYILTGRGNYQWNPEYTLQVDVEKFQEEYDAYMTHVSEIDAAKHRDAAMNLYQGMFLNSFEAEYWANLAIQYQSMFLKLADDLREELLKQEQYDELEKLCSRVLNTDPYDEEWNRSFIRALLSQNKVSHAEKYYRGLEKKIQNIKGTQKTSLLRLLRQELKGQGIVDKQISQADLIKELNSEKRPAGVYRCEYRDFKSLCQLQARRDKRHKETSYTLLITIYTEQSSLASATEVQDFLINMAMEELEGALNSNLRECDVICKCSASQYIVLLDRCTYENALRVARRVSELFEEKNSSKLTSIHLDVQKISISF